MSQGIASVDRPTNLSSDGRKLFVREQIELWIGNQRLDACLKAEEMGQLSMVQKMVALRNGLIIGAIRHCHLNPRADSRMSILTLITFLADNNEGVCHLSVTAMTEMLKRSRESVVTSIRSLEEQHQIGVNRVGGMPNCYWPLIPAALVEISANPVWFVNALRTSGPKSIIYHSPEAAIAAATNWSTAPDQSGAPDQFGNWSTPVDKLVNSSRPPGQVQSCSTSSLNSASNLGALPNQNSDHPPRSSGQRDMAMGVGGEAAFAENNITVDPTGKLIIGEDFRAQLREDFSDHDIDDGVNNTLAVMGAERNKTRILQQVRRQCGFARRDNGKASAFVARKPGFVRNGRPSL
jgi:hypothetical protein